MPILILLFIITAVLLLRAGTPPAMDPIIIQIERPAPQPSGLWATICLAIVAVLLVLSLTFPS